MKTPQTQNVHCREHWHKQRDGDATDVVVAATKSNGQAFSIRLTVSVSVVQDVIKIKRLGKSQSINQSINQKRIRVTKVTNVTARRLLHSIRWKCNYSCVL